MAKSCSMARPTDTIRRCCSVLGRTETRLKSCSLSSGHFIKAVSSEGGSVNPDGSHCST
ncbi:hypothetical protein B0H12DRAFT_1136003 [Mycena haematopus]|nr:hypothetical protein B0H12DRAFT_1136003 [Mycena haematopus]